ncbi:hypothetical protein PCE1_001125 [Barthelona sp. PCE]
MTDPGDNPPISRMLQFENPHTKGAEDSELEDNDIPIPVVEGEGFFDYESDGIDPNQFDDVPLDYESTIEPPKRKTVTKDAFNDILNQLSGYKSEQIVVKTPPKRESVLGLYRPSSALTVSPNRKPVTLKKSFSFDGSHRSRPSTVLGLVGSMQATNAARRVKLNRKKNRKSENNMKKDLFEAVRNHVINVKRDVQRANRMCESLGMKRMYVFVDDSYTPKTRTLEKIKIEVYKFNKKGKRSKKPVRVISSVAFQRELKSVQHRVSAPSSIAVTNVSAVPKYDIYKRGEQKFPDRTENPEQYKREMSAKSKNLVVATSQIVHTLRSSISLIKNSRFVK